MKASSRYLHLPVAIVAALSLLTSGCDSAESRVQQAFADYEAAKAAGDIQAARIALLRLVSADDSVASYWAELGKLQLQLGAYSDAYYALQRAHELDRSNIEVAASLTQLALLSGDTDAAEQRARDLEIVAPGHPAIKLTDGYVALRRGRLDDANRFADEIIAAAPFDPNGKLLKARIMVAEQRYADAAAYLTEHLQTAAEDMGSMQALASLLRRLQDWPALGSVARQMVQANPADSDAKLLFIEAAFRSGEVEAGRAASAELVTKQPALAEKVLELWATLWRSPAALAEARRLVAQNPQGFALTFATYFNRAGAPEDAAKLLGNAPQRPVSRSNSSLNSLLAESMALRGQAAEAKRLLDEILAVEPDHVHALRTRTELQIRGRSPKAAVRDAQRLVSVQPDSSRDRLLLAQAYNAAGDGRQVDRTLWNAFHDIPADPALYEALSAHVARSQGQAGAARVAEEFRAQADQTLVREFKL